MKRMKAGLIGCGMISEIYLKNCSERFRDVEFIACADRDMEAAQRRARQFGLRACSVEQLLEDPDIEVVLNLTIPAFHADITRRILLAGKHAYSEKPLATTLADAENVCAIAKEKRLNIGCAPDTFLGAGIQTCKALIDSGTIGRPIAAQAFMLSRGPEHFHPNPAFLYQPGAGPLLDWGPYYITALVALLGPVKRLAGMGKKTYETRRVLAEDSPKSGEEFPVDVPTYTTAVLEFESGVIANLTITFDMPFAHENSDMPFIKIYGTQGTVHVPDVNTFGGPVFVRDGGSTPQQVELISDITADSRGIGLCEMAAAVHTGGHYRANGALALHVTEVMLGIKESMETGQFYNIKNMCANPRNRV